MLLLQHHVGPCVYMWKRITGFSACTTCMLEGPTPFCRKEEHSKPWSSISSPHLMTTKDRSTATKAIRIAYARARTQEKMDQARTIPAAGQRS